MGTSTKLTLAALGAVLALSACGGASGTSGPGPGSTARAASSQRGPEAVGSNLQDMKDLYALKRAVAAVRRGLPWPTGEQAADRPPSTG